MADTDPVLERERRELEAARDRDFVRKVADGTSSLLVVVDDEATVVGNSVNKGFERAMGWSEEEMLGRSLLELFRPGERDPAAAAVLEASGGVEATERTSHWRTREGEERVIAWSAAPIVDMSGRELVLVCGVDLTERYRYEAELRASRTRIVHAADEARRALERNLHDGAQQRLVALSLSLRLAQARIDSDPAEASRLLDASRQELAHALEELRELARGLHPAILSERGLGGALQAVAALSPVPVELNVIEERLPAHVEAAFYYVVAEALTNVAKYADATGAEIEVRRDGCNAVVEVLDDGVGGAANGVDPSALGSGLRGLADRLAALDGRLVVESPAGGGTRVRAEIPLA